MWFKIIKQGKILTLPKTQLRIKKPDKVEEERTCKDKLIQLNEELKNEKGILETISDIWKQEDYINAKYWDIRYTHKSNTARRIRIIPTKENPVKHHHIPWGAFEDIRFMEKSAIEKIPEEICCAALDLLNEVSVNGNKDTYSNKGWVISTEYWIEEHSQKLPVEHPFTHHEFMLTISYAGDDGEGHEGMGISLSAPSDWIEEYDIDWR